MKNLQDELKKLDNEEYKVSKDFSKNVIKSIKHENILLRIKSIASLASVACVLVVAVIYANKSGLIVSLTSKQADEIIPSYNGQVSLDSDGLTEEASRNPAYDKSSSEGYNIQSNIAADENKKFENNNQESAKAVEAVEESIFFDNYVSGDGIKLVTDVLIKNEIEYSIEDNNKIIITNSDISIIKAILKEIEVKEIKNEADTVVVLFK